MDLGTGRIYDSKDAALAAGVAEADLIQVERDGEYWKPTTKIAAPHQSTREMQRRARQLAAGIVK